MEIPETRWTRTVDGVHIAYQVVGDGPLDIVFVTSTFASNMEIAWEWGYMASFFRELASRSRLLLFDRRGTGLSDAVSGESLPTLDARMDDIRAVMDASHSERAVIWGLEGAQCFLFAAAYPERTAGLITLGVTSRGTWASENPWLWTEERWAEWLSRIEADWGSVEFVQDFVRSIFPSHMEDAEFVRGYWRVVRHSLSPGDAVAAERMYKETDVRHVLPSIQARSLVLHVAEDQMESVQEGRYIAEHIPGADFVELPGTDHGWMSSSVLFSPVDRFLASLQDEQAAFDRVLATVLFTDIVGSTKSAAELGDTAWRELLERHHAAVRAMIGRYRGTEVNTAGDGFLATFDGPARGVRCAQAIVEAVQPLGLEIRAGCHTGEIELAGEDVRGLAVHIGARVAALAGPSEVLVSSTVKDLVAGSGLTFEVAGEHELKGVPDRWRLYRVVSRGA